MLQRLRQKAAENPDLLTEDEDDILYIEQHKDEPTVPFDEVLREDGRERVDGRIQKIGAASTPRHRRR